MTGYTVHTGTSIKFSEGWDRIFAGDTSTKAKKASAKKQQPVNSAKAAKKPSASNKAAAKKAAGKRVSAGKVQSKRAALRSRSSGQP